MKEGAPQLAKYNHEFALEACEHSLWPLHCRPEEEVNGAQERLAQAVWIKHNVRGCCQSEYRRVACGLATWTQIESRVTLLVPIGVPGHMLEQTIVDVHNECPNTIPYEQRPLGLSVADEKQRTLRVPHSLLFLNFSSIFRLKNCIPPWPKAVPGKNRLVGNYGLSFPAHA